MGAAPELRVGTCGWSYDHWAGVFYPERLPPARRLEHYATRFDTVEIDATFYRLPSANAVRAWRGTVPEGFAFAVKGSRLITHFRRLGDVDEALRVFLERVGLLGDKLAVVLWQLPPALRRDDALLARFLERLPRGRVRHAVEFRHGSWLAPAVFGLLEEHGTALVNVSGDVMPEDLTVTGGYAYVRFHGTVRYHGAYRRPALEPWADHIGGQLAAGRDCYAYFNNDAEGHAPADAARLLGMIEERRGAARKALGEGITKRR